MSSLATSASNAMARVGRESGYGDFVFGRLLKRHRVQYVYWEWDRPFNIVHGTALQRDALYKYESVGDKIKWPMFESSMADYELRTQNKAHVELNNFVRKGVFPYQKLPAEIRQQILGMVLEECFVFNQASSRALLEFTITHPFAYGDDVFQENFSGDESNFLAVCEAESEFGFDTKDDDEIYQERDEGETRRLLSRQSKLDISIIKDNYAKLKTSYFKSIESHPERMVPYNLSLHIKTEFPIFIKNVKEWRTSKNDTDTWISNSIDFPMLNHIRMLSNLNTTLREDLGAVIWANTKLRISCASARHGSLVGFFIDRPLITVGIRSICLEILAADLFEKHSSKTLDDTSFSYTCHALSKLPNLAELQLNFCVDGKQIGDVKKFYDKFSGHRSCRFLRGIPVSSKFEVTMEAEHWRDSDGVVAKYTEKLRVLLLPETLRAQVSIQEKL